MPVLEVPKLSGHTKGLILPVRIHIPLAHCDLHQTFVEAKDFLEDRRFRQEAHEFIAESKIVADWRGATLRWIRVVESDHDLKRVGPMVTPASEG